MRLPKEDTSTFTPTRQGRHSLFNLSLSVLFPSFPDTLQNFLSGPPSFFFFLTYLFTSPFMCSLFLLSSPLFTFPRGNSFRSRHFCLSLFLPLSHNFKQSRRSGHADVPGASVTVPSQVYVSQCVLDDTFSLSPISLLLISAVSS